MKNFHKVAKEIADRIFGEEVDSPEQYEVLIRDEIYRECIYREDQFEIAKQLGFDVDSDLFDEFYDVLDRISHEAIRIHIQNELNELVENEE